jgi:hypothetical protein
VAGFIHSASSAWLISFTTTRPALAALAITTRKEERPTRRGQRPVEPPARAAPGSPPCPEPQPALSEPREQAYTELRSPDTPHGHQGLKVVVWGCAHSEDGGFEFDRASIQLNDRTERFCGIIPCRCLPVS